MQRIAIIYLLLGDSGRLLFVHFGIFTSSLVLWSMLLSIAYILTFENVLPSLISKLFNHCCRFHSPISCFSNGSQFASISNGSATTFRSVGDYLMADWIVLYMDIALMLFPQILNYPQFLALDKGTEVVPTHSLANCIEQNTVFLRQIGAVPFRADNVDKSFPLLRRLYLLSKCPGNQGEFAMFATSGLDRFSADWEHVIGW